MTFLLTYLLTYLLDQEAITMKYYYSKLVTYFELQYLHAHKLCSSVLDLSFSGDSCSPSYSIWPHL